MTELLEKLNVKMTFSSVYTPEQNPYAERSNYSIWSMARTMLLQAKMQKMYWGYAILYATEILMCLPKKALGWKTPKQVLTGRKPDISRFKVFGCKAWALVPKPHRKKLDPRAKCGIFVGFSQDAPAYLVRIPSTGEVIESPHCIFDESDFGGESPLNVSTMKDLEEALAPPKSACLSDVGISMRDLMEETNQRCQRTKPNPTNPGVYDAVLSEQSPVDSTSTEAGRGGAGQNPANMQGKRTRRGTKRRRALEEPKSKLFESEEPAPLHSTPLHSTPLHSTTNDQVILEEEAPRVDTPEGAKNDQDKDDSDSGYDDISSTDSDANSDPPDPINKRRSGRKRKATKQYTYGSKHHDQHGNAISSTDMSSWGQAARVARSGLPIAANAGKGTKRSPVVSFMCYMAAAVSLYLDVQGSPLIEQNDCKYSYVLGAPKHKQKKDNWDTPSSFWKAVDREDGKLWWEAWNKEKNSMLDLGVLQQCDWPTDGTNVCGSQLVCKIKRLQDGSIDKYKVRWVCQGFSQRFGVDYFDTASPVAMPTSVRILLNVACQFTLDCFQGDVSTAYLRAPMDTVVYMAPPKGCDLELVNGKRQCFLVIKSIYGTKQGGRNWFMKCHRELFLDDGWEMCPYDNCLFAKRKSKVRDKKQPQGKSQNQSDFTNFDGDQFIIATLYVDDVLFTGNWDSEVKRFRSRLSKLYDLNDINPISWFLGWHITRDKDEGWLKISQKQFIIDALARFGLQDVHPKSIPVSSTYTFEEVDESCALDKGQQKLYMEKVGTLNYLATQSKASIAWVTSKLGQYMHQADMHHMQIADGVYAWITPVVTVLI